MYVKFNKNNKPFNDMTKLNVPLVRQRKNSIDCGLACVCMLLKYYGIEKSIDDLKNEIELYDGVGTYEPELAEYLVKNGFDVEIITINPYLFTKKFKNKSKRDLVFYLRNLYKKTQEENFREAEKYFEKFIKAGGKLTIKVPTIADIRQELLSKRPLLVSLTSNFLISDSPSFNFHYNLITGISNDYIYVNDPLWDKRGGSHKYLINDFLYAIYASAHGEVDNASVMKVIKKK